MADTVRVRIAPSPTGKLHIGTARTALFNYLFAKRHGGTFVVRMEDTDKDRSNDEYVKDILEGLLWLGIGWDEGPEVGGAFGPYFQQERLDIYDEHIDRLLEEKKAYRCYCTTEELDIERKRQQERSEPPKYSGKCRQLSAQEIDAFERAGRQSVVRFLVEPQPVSFDDLIRGKIETDAALIGDFVIRRSDGSPLFVFSNAIDDHLMEITHVLRGEDHLSNTAKQILLAQALNFLSPQFGHFPLILNADRSKMSKRKDPVSITDDFKAKGYLPEALINFIVLLGWSSGTDKEIFTMRQLIEEFQIERVGTSPAIFDRDKLLWMNGSYIRHADVGEVASQAQNFIIDKTLFQKTLDQPDYFLSVIALIQDRLKTLDEVESLIGFFYQAPKYDAELLIAKKSDRSRTVKALEVAAEAIKGLRGVTLEETEIALRTAAKEAELKDGEVLWAVRVALSGSGASPGVFELIEVLGKEESLKRVRAAAKLLAGTKDK